MSETAQTTAAISILTIACSRRRALFRRFANKLDLLALERADLLTGAPSLIAATNHHHCLDCPAFLILFRIQAIRDVQALVADFAQERPLFRRQAQLGSFLVRFILNCCPEWR